MKKRILSGIRPTGELHIGNYFGAISNWVTLQEENECFFMIADWHVLTTDYDSGAEIKETSLQVAIDLLASGIDPKKCTLFVQSSVQEHAELALMLSMVTPLAWLERNPTYKEQIQELKGRELHTHGFLGYPVLQAADILLYEADSVPVGGDQLPHIELTREIARRFNYIYGNVFKEPQALLTPISKLPGTDGRKMSKSYNNCIYLSDTRDVIEGKIKKMFTDPARKRRNDKGHPDKCPVCYYQTIFNKENLDEIKKGCSTAGIGCMDCKKMLLDKFLPFMETLSSKRSKYEAERESVTAILEKGAQVARAKARSVLEKARQLVKI
ncbi:tryptophan--tRNA ligase [Candidatus Omnitrophota bacterium]